MSTHYDVLCLSCYQSATLGVRCAVDHWSFGHASNDEATRRHTGRFIQEHDGHDLRIVNEHDERLVDAQHSEAPEDDPAPPRAEERVRLGLQSLALEPYDSSAHMALGACTRIGVLALLKEHAALRERVAHLGQVVENANAALSHSQRLAEERYHALAAAQERADNMELERNHELEARIEAEAERDRLRAALERVANPNLSAGAPEETADEYYLALLKEHRDAARAALLPAHGSLAAQVEQWPERRRAGRRWDET